MKKLLPMVLAATSSGGVLFVSLSALAENRQAHGMYTEWGEKVTSANAWREYPRPQMVRENWECLNGTWNYAITDASDGIPSKWEGNILVPFAAGSALSGVPRIPKHTQALWYRKTFDAVPVHGERILLHIDGCDFRTQVFVNGREVRDFPHESAQLAFSCDITDFVKAGENTVVLQVWDPMGGNGHVGFSYGKQTLKPSGCFYTASSGVWAPVWLETVPDTYVSGYKVTPDFDAGTVSVLVEGAGDVRNAQASVEVLEEGRTVVKVGIERWGEPIVVKLPAPVRPWSPDTPFLYGLNIALGRDRVKGYFGFRKFEVAKDPNGTLRFFLNGKMIFPIGTLDQGWWPDGLLTPPSDEAMAWDIRLLKRMGFNMMRKHIKVEPMRYYHLCDTLGMLVFQDMPSGGGDLNGRYGFYRRELKGMIDQLYNVPSIVMWIPYNERWGQPKGPQTSWTLKWVKKYDPSRVVDGPSGWSDYEGGYTKSIDGKGTLVRTRHLPEGVPESADVIDFHAYPGPVMLPVNSHRASFIGEFGGLGLSVEKHLWNPKMRNWGYGGGSDADVGTVQARYVGLMDKLAELAYLGCAGSVYTQTTDVEGEINGLATYDRKVVKFDEKVLAAAHATVREMALRGTLPRRRLDIFPKNDPSPAAWAYAFCVPSSDWMKPDFDDSAWPRSAGGFGSKEISHANRDAVVSTMWNGKDIWLRRTFTMPECDVLQLMFEVFHDEDAEVYVNGTKVLSLKGYNKDYTPVFVPPSLHKVFRPGRNVIAVHVKQTSGGQYIDMGLSVFCR